MTAMHLQQWIQHPELLNEDTLGDLRDTLKRYPYFQSARLLLLQNLHRLHDIGLGAALHESVPYLADRRTLFFLVEAERYELKPQPAATEEEHAPVSAAEDRTLALIDSFLAEAPAEPAAALDYTVDYTPYLLQESDAVEPAGCDGRQQMRGQELIDHFIARSEDFLSDHSLSARETAAATSDGGGLSDTGRGAEEPPVALPPSLASEMEDDSYFTETLAKIYVKQHRYDKALEIIKKLSLKYPKKSTYFASQIGLLEDLIINAKTK